MEFDKIRAKRNVFAARKNDTKEKVYEFEFYDIIFTLLDCIDSFDRGVRKIDFTPDVYELISKLKRTSDTLDTNIKYLKVRR